jgi:hypothetical protein
LLRLEEVIDRLAHDIPIFSDKFVKLMVDFSGTGFESLDIDILPAGNLDETLYLCLDRPFLQCE